MNLPRDQYRHLYRDRRWHRLRRRQLNNAPMCSMCAQLGRVKAAEVVDHITPHKGDEALFFDEANLQSLCKPCHDRHKQRQERSGILVGCDVNGYPLDSNSHWN